MVRACSLSRILFPRASALCKIKVIFYNDKIRRIRVMSWINSVLNSRNGRCLGLTSDLTHDLDNVLD
ncbi:hypothetical protein BU072_07625 [Mammaliicoccus vitulinus]|uniref:Uncharacterized protein n=1 Tax=Mammaliicoccus vitulinus TaxID=71237 RepID=A0A2T4PT30_9STAP|nr:hypothetical protein BU072_07625 [Mammaliicoccus vitulinus]RIN23205.1 hypothetical protein BU070_07145 [Mammaliicoccus vitulinus]